MDERRRLIVAITGTGCLLGAAVGGLLIGWERWHGIVAAGSVVLATAAGSLLAYHLGRVCAKEPGWDGSVEKLSSRRDVLARVMGTSPVGITVVDRAGRIVFANRRAQEVLHLRQDEITERTYDAPEWKITDYEGRALPETQLPFPRVMSTGEPVENVKHAIEGSDGRRVLLSISAAPLIGPAGEPVGIVSAIDDVTEQVATLEALRWDLAVNEALSALYEPLISPKSTIQDIATRVLDQAKRLTGSEHGYVSTIDPTTGDSVLHTLVEMLAGSCQVSGPDRRIVFPRGADGRYPGLWGYSLNTREAFFTNDAPSHAAARGLPKGHIPIRRFLSMPVMLGQELVGQIAIANSSRDYTERDIQGLRRMAEFYALAIQRMRAEEEYRTVIQTALDGFWILDVSGRFLDVNEAYCALTGYSRQELLSMRVQDVEAVESAADTAAHIERVRAAGADRFETRHRCKDGRIVDLEVSARHLRAGGERLFVFLSDITARKVRESERLAMIDSLMRIRGALELRVQEQTSDLTRAVETLQEEVEARVRAEAERRRLEAEVLRASERERRRIGHDLHDGLGQNLAGTAFLSNVLHQKLAALSMPEAADAAEIERLLNQSVKVAKALARGLSPVGVTPQSLAQGLQELAAGTEETFGIQCDFAADDAVEVHDSETAAHLYRIAQEAVSNAFRHGRARHIGIRLRGSPDGIRLTVEDDGIGLPKEPNEDKGMGLRIMNFRATSIGGSLRVVRRAQGGTAVICTLGKPEGFDVQDTGNGIDQPA